MARYSTTYRKTTYLYTMKHDARYYDTTRYDPLRSRCASGAARPRGQAADRLRPGLPGRRRAKVRDPIEYVRFATTPVSVNKTLLRKIILAGEAPNQGEE